LNLAQSLIKAKAAGIVPVIAEIKRLIPKLADKDHYLPDSRDAGLLAKDYENGGAAGISLVTEKRFFGGNPEEDIPAVLRASTLPLLIKDFIFDETGIDYYAELLDRLGDSRKSRVTILLIAHLLKEKLPAVLEQVYSYGMEALVETRGTEDIPCLKEIAGKLTGVGFNNKDIDKLEKEEDIIRLTPKTAEAYRQVIGDALLVCQSAHRSPDDALFSLSCGADAVLVGTAFMLSRKPAEKVASFVRASMPGGRRIS